MLPESSIVPAFALSPFDIPHILDRILSHVESTSRPSCLQVNKTWYAAAAPKVWEKCFVGWGYKGPSWDDMINNIQHVHNLAWHLTSSRETCLREVSELSIALLKNGSTNRLECLFIRGQDVLQDAIDALLPSVPQLRRLTIARKDRKGRCVVQIPLEDIVTKLVHLKELHLLNGACMRMQKVENNADLEDSTSDSQENIELELKKDLSVEPSLSLRILDFGKTDITAQQIIEISSLFPNLESLCLDCLPLLDSIVNYQSQTKNHGEISAITRATNTQIKSQVFAMDFASAWPTLRNLTLHLEGLITDLKVTTPADAFIFAKYLVTALAPQLKVLNLPTAIMNNTVFDAMSDSFNTNVDNQPRGRPTPGQHRTFLQETFLEGKIELEQFSTNGYHQGVSDRLDTGKALLRFLESATSIKVLELGGLHIGSAILERPGYSTSDGSNSEDAGPQENTIHSSHPAIYSFLGRSDWTCKNLRYLHLNGTSGEPSIPSRLYNQDEDFELSRALYRQISKLTQLQFLWLEGFIFSQDLEKSGFHQLESLNELRVLIVGIHWAHEGTDTSVLKNVSPDSILGFLTNSDIQWMMKTWPKLKNLNLGGPSICNTHKLKIQGWLDEFAGPGRNVTMREGYSIAYEYRLD
ncbi:hypothetical protein BGZ49_006931 [Haplosporangium sp. Z 27]|nr:hypothetical protein BGZ49_006931 [Haplosporangium sp. Z 27]